MTERRFTQDHEWVELSGDTATVGISNFAQDQLGDIVSIEFPEISSKFKQKEAMAIVDSVKASSDIYCPMDGTIIEINKNLQDHPELINKSPYDEGWMLKLKVSNISQFENLMTQQQYEKFVGEEKG
ncbi:MAG: glycine cleavage system protein GcvH [Thaumarchaeota archaeon]|nr:glycine cleavage system protein GcvH [Nitrososphaerota archaeon]